MDDGLVLRADIFRPVEDGRYPVILTYGPYGKGLDFKEGYKTALGRNGLRSDYPESLQDTSGKYMNWEVVDPEKWVPDGYVCVRVDSRGAGRSPGFLDTHGRRGRPRISTIASNGRRLSPGRAARSACAAFRITPEPVAGRRAAATASGGDLRLGGRSDYYRDNNRHGGILCVFRKNW